MALTGAGTGSGEGLVAGQSGDAGREILQTVVAMNLDEEAFRRLAAKTAQSWEHFMPFEINSKNELIEAIKNAYSDGKFVTQKHDPMVVSLVGDERSLWGAPVPGVIDMLKKIYAMLCNTPETPFRRCSPTRSGRTIQVW